jgi:hypothetical protein
MESILLRKLYRSHRDKVTPRLFNFLVNAPESVGRAMSPATMKQGSGDVRQESGDDAGDVFRESDRNSITAIPHPPASPCTIISRISENTSSMGPRVDILLPA